MSNMDVFNFLVGVLGIVSFLFSIWVWMRSDYKIRELSEIIDAIHDITGVAIWEWETTLSDDIELRLRHAEKILGFVESIRKLAQRYIKTPIKTIPNNMLGQLIERGIIVPQSKVWDIETSKTTSNIWLATPDLRPDNSNDTVGKLINQNLKQGKQYIYFVPESIPHLDSEIERLFKNIGIANSQAQKLKDKISIVIMNKEKYSALFPGGNVIFYFQDEQKGKTPRCFEEIVLTQISQRGAFWQEHSESKANEFFHILENTRQEIKNHVKQSL